jgi:hypothetical protein
VTLPWKSSKVAARRVVVPIILIFLRQILLLDGLFCIARARKLKRRWAPFAKKCSYVLRKRAINEQTNFLGKHLILDAELSALGRKPHKAMLLKYVNAVTMAKESGSLLEYALASELTAKHLIRQGDKETAEKHIRKSIQIYLQWGAIARAKYLLEEMGSHGFKDLRISIR